MLGDYIFHIGSFGVPAMGFCILIGTVLALFLTYYAKRFTSLDWDDEVLDGIIWAVFGGFIGMKLLYWLVTPEVLLDVIAHPTWKGVWDLITAGMVFYGGLIGGVIGLLLLCLKRKRNFFTFSDLILPGFCIAHAGGRIGCLLVGCCYGVAQGETCLGGLCVYDGTLAVTYLNCIRRLPVPMMESMFLILLAAVLLLMLKNSRHRGTVTAWYLILYAIWRFVIEYFRGDAVRGIYGPFSTSQWIGIAILAAGVIILVLSRKWPKDEPHREFREADFTVPEPEPKPEPKTEPEPEAAPAPEPKAEAAPEPEAAPEAEAAPAAESASDAAASDEDGGDADGGDGDAE